MTTIEIPLTQGKVALIDEEDYPLVSQHKWSTICPNRRSPSFYAHTRINLNKWAYMHRMILKAKGGQIIDHVNGNGLDNRKNNLRFATHRQNMRNQRLGKRNKSGFKGVYLRTNSISAWKAQIKLHNKMVYIGLFLTPEAAARAYDRAAIKYFGEFARTNFPRSQYTQSSDHPDRIIQPCLNLAQGVSA